MNHRDGAHVARQVPSPTKPSPGTCEINSNSIFEKELFEFDLFQWREMSSNSFTWAHWPCITFLYSIYNFCLLPNQLGSLGCTTLSTATVVGMLRRASPGPVPTRQLLPHWPRALAPFQVLVWDRVSPQAHYAAKSYIFQVLDLGCVPSSLVFYGTGSDPGLLACYAYTLPGFSALPLAGILKRPHLR